MSLHNRSYQVTAGTVTKTRLLFLPCWLAKWEGKPRTERSAGFDPWAAGSLMYFQRKGGSEPKSFFTHNLEKYSVVQPRETLEQALESCVWETALKRFSLLKETEEKMEATNLWCYINKHKQGRREKADGCFYCHIFKNGFWKSCLLNFSTVFVSVFSTPCNKPNPPASDHCVFLEIHNSLLPYQMTSQICFDTVNQLYKIREQGKLIEAA